MAASVPHQYSSNYTNFVINNYNNMVPLMSCEDTNSPVSVASFPDQQLSETFEMGFAAYDYNQHHRVFEPKYFCPAYNSMPAQNWEFLQAIQRKPATKVEQTTEVKVGRYTVEEKKDRILRYLKKKNQRNFNKTIKYACRKTLADKRVRVRGRFAKNNEEDGVMNTTRDTSYERQNNSLVYVDTFQMKYEEDDWLQAAMANLVNLPYLAI